MVHAIFYMHQNSGACVGMCTCDCTHPMKKTVIVSKRERNSLTYFNVKVQINNVKMETFFFCPPACPVRTNRRILHYRSILHPRNILRIALKALTVLFSWFLIFKQGQSQFWKVLNFFYQTFIIPMENRSTVVNLVKTGKYQ